MTWLHGLEAICRTDVPLADHTWYRLGGPARWFFTSTNADQARLVIGRCFEHRVPLRVLGHGANILVRDEGFDGAVLKLGGDLERVEFAGEHILAGGAFDFPKLVKRSLERSLVGLERLAGIPGTLGGVIRMNAGGRYGEIAEFVETIDIITPEGERVTRTVDEAGFSYRHSELDGCVVLGAKLRLSVGDGAEARRRFGEIWQEKYRTQPPMAMRSSGCIFRNPPGDRAGALIDRVGLKGQRCGGAEISSIHANFVVAGPDARSHDVLHLIELAKDRVRAATGVELQPEVDIW